MDIRLIKQSICISFASDGFHNPTNWVSTVFAGGNRRAEIDWHTDIAYYVLSNSLSGVVSQYSDT